MSSNSPVFNAANFRQQFPAFANETTYPDAALEFAWDMGANWIVQNCSASWGLASNTKRWQQAADLMGTVVMQQLYPQGGVPAGGGAPGPISSATEGSISVTFQLPAFGSSAFSALLLSTPPYGTMLLALLQISASVGPYICSGRFARVPP